MRTGQEHQEKRIAGSISIPLLHLQDRLYELPRERLMVVHCASGYRSSIAISLLEQVGITGVADLVGGIAAWETAQLPVISSRV